MPRAKAKSKFFKVVRIDRKSGDETTLHANYTNKDHADAAALEYVADAKTDRYRYEVRPQANPLSYPYESGVKIKTTDGSSLKDAFTSFIKGAIAAAPKGGKAKSKRKPDAFDAFIGDAIAAAPKRKHSRKKRR